MKREPRTTIYYAAECSKMSALWEKLFPVPEHAPDIKYHKTKAWVVRYPHTLEITHKPTIQETVNHMVRFLTRKRVEHTRATIAAQGLINTTPINKLDEALHRNLIQLPRPHQLLIFLQLDHTPSIYDLLSQAQKDIRQQRYEARLERRNNAATSLAARQAPPHRIIRKAMGIIAEHLQHRIEQIHSESTPELTRWALRLPNPLATLKLVRMQPLGPPRTFPIFQDPNDPTKVLLFHRPGRYRKPRLVPGRMIEAANHYHFGRTLREAKAYTIDTILASATQETETCSGNP